jgi:hypothetical protein
MSQQEMRYEEQNSHRVDKVHASYDGLPPHESQQQQFGGLYGQKLSEPASVRIPTVGQRLLLAIVSLIMLMVMTFGLIIIGIAANIHSGGAFGVVIALTLFYVAVIIINVLFNRK